MKRTTILSHVAFLLIGISIGALLTFGPNIYELTIQQSSGAVEVLNPPRDNVQAIIMKQGDILTINGHNTWTTIGKRYHRNFLWFHNITGTDNNNNATFGFIGWVSLGNATVADTLTKLTTEAITAGAGRKAFDTVVVYNNATYASRMANATVTFTFSGTIRIDAVGFHWSSIASSDNNLYSAFALTAATTFINGDQLIIKYYHRSDGT